MHTDMQNEIHSVLMKLLGRFSIRKCQLCARGRPNRQYLFPVCPTPIFARRPFPWHLFGLLVGFVLLLFEGCFRIGTTVSPGNPTRNSPAVYQMHQSRPELWTKKGIDSAISLHEYDKRQLAHNYII